ncbi:MAG: APC family permease [Acidobacteria bacterium]|nr:APC family permease [Acidobacteriota bacterium]
MGVGATVGGEILRLPGPVARAIPDRGLFLSAWLLGGLYAGLCALSFAELATRVPRTGGLTRFAEEALGPFSGFLVGWGDFLASAFTVAAYGLLVGELAAGLGVPGSPRLLAAGSVLLVVALQWPGLRPGSLVQDLASAAKGILLMGLALLGLFLAAPGEHPAGPPPGAGPVAFLGAMQLVIFAYDNFYAPVYFGEEYRNPGRALPRSLLGGVALVTLLYLTLAWGLSRGLSHGELAASAFPGEELGRRVFGPPGARIVAGILLLSLFSGMHATALIASRILFALGAEGLAWHHSTDVNRGGTPTTGLAATALLALCGLGLPSFEKAVQFMSPFVLLNYALCFASLLVLRRRDPHPPGVFLAPGQPLLVLLSLGGSLVFLAGSLLSEPRLAAGALLLAALAGPVYLSLRRWRRLPGAPQGPGQETGKGPPRW